MRVICAWCKKVIQDDSKELLSHGICPACWERMEHDIERNRMETRQPAEVHDFWDLLAYAMKGQVIAGAILVLLFFLTVVTAEVLHSITGGRIPALIDWQSEKHVQEIQSDSEE